jgi:hypothetical protein
MKAITIITAALIGGIALPAVAFANTMLGCEVKAVEGSNYVVKVDPTCNFAVTQTFSGPGGLAVAEAILDDLTGN